MPGDELPEGSSLRLRTNRDGDVQRITNEIQGYIAARGQISHAIVTACGVAITMLVLISNRNVAPDAWPSLAAPLQATAFAANCVYALYLWSGWTFLNDLIMLGGYLACSGQSDWEARILPALQKHLGRRKLGMGWRFGLNRQMYVVYFAVSLLTPFLAACLLGWSRWSSWVEVDRNWSWAVLPFVPPVIVLSLILWRIRHAKMDQRWLATWRDVERMLEDE
ncbi:MAG: hypothetical protein SGJ19_23045 [Planctomycetia bacterium]|nr:hypothetical protein [Planctomycetia bacterium]